MNWLRRLFTPAAPTIGPLEDVPEPAKEMVDVIVGRAVHHFHGLSFIPVFNAINNTLCDAAVQSGVSKRELVRSAASAYGHVTPAISGEWRKGLDAEGMRLDPSPDHRVTRIHSESLRDRMQEELGGYDAGVVYLAYLKLAAVVSHAYEQPRSWLLSNVRSCHAAWTRRQLAEAKGTQP